MTEFSHYKVRDGKRPRANCKACHNAAEKNRDKSHRVTITKDYKRAERFGRLYGITIETYETMKLAQNGRCVICKNVVHLLVVDHCHETGVVRGLLCQPCNTGIGLLRDDVANLKAAIAYLEESQ